MSQFEATIVGKLDLGAARAAWNSFVSELQRPIQIRIDPSSFNFQGLQRNFQNLGRQMGNAINGSLRASMGQNGWSVNQNVVRQTQAQIDALRQQGIEVQRIQNTISRANGLQRQVMTGADANGNIVRITQQLGQAQDQITQHTIDFQRQQAEAARAVQQQMRLAEQQARQVQQMQRATNLQRGQQNLAQSNFANTQRNAQNDAIVQAGRARIEQLKQQQAEMRHIAQETAASLSSLGLDAKSSSMAAGLAKYGKYENSQIQGLQQAREAAAAYNAELQKLKSSYDASTNTFKLPDREVNQSYTKMAQSAEKYANAMSMVRAESSMMIKDGANITAANQVDAWASKNTRALKKYGDELTRISNQMRSTQDAYELKDLQGQYRNIRLQAQAEGLTGNSMWSSLKQSFGKISAFTGIYALTSQIQQVPIKMVEAVRDINKAQIELRKVSSASDTELESYWNRASDAAKTYGATISDVIQSTADWSRLK